MNKYLISFFKKKWLTDPGCSGNYKVPPQYSNQNYSSIIIPIRIWKQEHRLSLPKNILKTLHVQQPWKEIQGAKTKSSYFRKE